MAALYTMTEKAKAVLILIAAIVALTHQIMQHLLKIFDDSELTVPEATAFVAEQGQGVFGFWREQRGKGKGEA